MTETQKKDEGIFFENKVTVHHSNINKEDKKGGGLMIQRKQLINLKNIENKENIF